ncbi:MAG: 2-C-methyl-D-erythritol 2,4-cyclodiphosphate synthase [Treponema sp.]|jgi:2-C-methyl-D-erythritol 2,4-cyclodiphosphate synthase|nr:2-C-methyl-D-erythritol 2,4-cyclodiphosphate synthase [Treponema sp.]
MLRIGLGRDLHRLVGGRRFLLGGVELASPVGEQGHSDGDVLIHALIDALLGAAGLGDIGALFPPSDAAWKDADSLRLLAIAFDTVKAAGWSVVNVDCVVTCERPKLLPYRSAICASLAAALDVPADVIFVKGKTNEGCDALGEGRAVEALVVCLLERDAPRGADEK